MHTDMRRQGYFSTPGRLPALIALIAGALLAAMGWLAWRMLEQDLVIEKQRRQERMENAAGLLCRELDRVLIGLGRGSLESHAGSVFRAAARCVDLLAGFAGGLSPARRCRFHSTRRRRWSDEPAPALFAKAEEWEFRQGDPPGQLPNTAYLPGRPTPACAGGSTHAPGPLSAEAGQDRRRARNLCRTCRPR